MQEKFSKLFAALLFTALLFGLALPSHSAAAEEIPTGVITFTASDGLASATTGVVVAITGNTMTKGTGAGAFATYSVYTSAIESGAKTLFISGVIPGASNDAVVTVTGLVPGKLYWFWVTACDSLNNCSSPFGDSGWQMVTHATNFTADSGFVGIQLTFDKSAAGLSVGGSYRIYRKLHSADWPASAGALALTAPLATITTPGATGTVTTYDFSAQGWLLDGTDAPEYDYLLLTCGPDKCEDGAFLADPVDTDTDETAQRPQPGEPINVNAVGSTTAATITVTWSAGHGIQLPIAPDSAGRTAFDMDDMIDRFYAQRTLGAVTLPVPPVSFDRYTFSGIDRWAAANTVYTYSVWACSTGSENCSDKASGDGFYTSNPVVSGLVASDGNVVDAAGDPVTYITWPAPNWPVVNFALPNAEPTPSNYYYNLYRSDDAAGLVNLAVMQHASDHLPGATLFYYDTTGNLGQTYYYYVRACFGGVTLPGILGSQSENGEICYDPSNVDSGWAPIPAPSLTLTNSTSGVTATWSETDINISYLGFRSPTSSFADAIPVGGVAIAGLTGTDTTGVAGTTYYYFLKACLGTRCSEPSVGKPGVKLLP